MSSDWSQESSEYSESDDEDSAVMKESENEQPLAEPPRGPFSRKRESQRADSTGGDPNAVSRRRSEMVVGATVPSLPSRSSKRSKFMKHAPLPFNPVRHLAFYMSEMAQKNAVVR